MVAPQRVLLLGATGTIGRATAAELLRRGHDVVCPVRICGNKDMRRDLPEGVEIHPVGAPDRPAVPPGNRPGGAGFDALVSCMASRSGVPADAWAVDYRATLATMVAARDAGATRMVLLSAICVQKPRLAFQHAKRAMEAALIGSGLDYTIVRPTAFFKSLSGQIARVRAGKPYLIFGDGRGTACKPISDADLARFLADCLEDPARRNRILPVGGPGAAITPREQGARLFELTGRPPRFRSLPVALLRAAAGGLGAAGRMSPRLAAKAELARIGRYYATESMLVWDAARGRYDAAATPGFGTETLFDHYAKVLRGEATVDLREHRVF